MKACAPVPALLLAPSGMEAGEPSETPKRDTLGGTGTSWVPSEIQDGP